MSQYDNYADKYISMRKNMFDKNINAEFPVMLEFLGDIKNKRILDLGCGFGYYDVIYAERGARVTALDNSGKEIEYARAYARKQNVKGVDFIVHDISNKFPLKNSSVDVITSSLAFEHINDVDYLFKECYRVLKEEGIMVFSITNPVLFQEKSLIGRIKLPGKDIILGNYFEKRKIKRKWGKFVEMEHYHRPLETYFSAFLENGFELQGFREPQPKSEKITYHSKNPMFLVFKLKKK